jgi:hypothetical protein
MLARWTSAKNVLAQDVLDPPPLSDWERNVWMRAVEANGSREATRSVNRWRMTWPRVARLALAAACVVVIALIVIRQKPAELVKERQPPPSRTAPAELSRVVSAVKVEPNGQAEALAELAAGVDRLSEELQALQRKAERNNARQQVALSLDRFERW